MIRRILPAVGALAAAALLSSGLSSCSSVDRTNIAADVNGITITNQELSDLAGGSSDAAVLRNTLSSWIQVAALSNDDAPMNTAADLDKVRTATLERLLEELGDPGRADYEKGLSGSYVCMRAIPLDPSVAAADVMKEILGGLSFADAAAKYSAAENLAASGGIVADAQGNGCFDQASLDQAFPSLRPALEDLGLEVGVPDVLPDAGGEIIILLRPYDDLSTTERITVGQAELSGSIADAFQKADVWVNSRIGEWDQPTGHVVELGSSTTDGAGS